LRVRVTADELAGDDGAVQMTAVGSMPGEYAVVTATDDGCGMDQATLEHFGYRVIAAATPHAAIRMASHEPDAIDLLLTDVVTPEMDGRELATSLLDIAPNLRRLFM
jgi:CheY-like chemotaxis protein